MLSDLTLVAYRDQMNDNTPRGILWAQLRASTRSSHAQAEASLGALARPGSLSAYAELLQVLWGFQAPMVRLLDGSPLPEAAAGAARRRLPALAADLADLGVDSASLPEAAGLPALDEPGAAWGALYVTEGAALGGRVLCRLVTERLGAVPVRFLGGHETRTQPTWPELGRLADRYVRTEQDALLARRTAVASFAAFDAWAQAARRPRCVR